MKLLHPLHCPRIPWALDVSVESSIQINIHEGVSQKIKWSAVLEFSIDLQQVFEPIPLGDAYENA